MVIIRETERLIIRKKTLEDIPALLSLNSDPEVIRYTGDAPITNELEARKILEERVFPQWDQFKMGRFAVTDKTGELLGWCGLKFHPETNEVDLGYRFFKRHWGKGYATESSEACLDYGFNDLNLERIIAKAMPENVASIKVMIKLGMNFQGYFHDPTDPIPFIVYDLRKDQWKL